MSPAYVVTTGEYSDYRVDSVWTSRENAEARRAVLRSGRYPDVNEIEEFPLDSADVLAEVRCWQATAWIDADTGETTNQATYKGVAQEGVAVELNTAPFSTKRLACLTVSYVDKERAEKVRSERLAHIKAQIDTTGPLEDTP